MVKTMSRIFGAVTTVTVAMLVAAPAAVGSTITIDDFTEVQGVQSVAANTIVSSSINDGMLGGFRTMAVESTSSDLFGTSLAAQSGSLSFNNSAGVTGRGWVVFDGTGDRTLTNDNSIGIGVRTNTFLTNLLPIGNITTNFFSFDLSSFNPGLGGATALFSAFAWDVGGARAEFSEIVGAASVSPDLFLSEFTGAIDWANVSALAFKIDSTQGMFDGNEYGGVNFDGKLGAVTYSVIPLPASALLLLGGLGSLAGVSVVARRRQRA